jgi:hypothetical protein
MPDPRKVHFYTQAVAEFKGGGAWAADEYGRRLAKDDDPEIKKHRDKEWNTHQRARQSWDTSFGELSDRELRKSLHGFDIDD